MQGAIQVHTSLECDTVSSGEPVVVHCRVRNMLAEELSVYVGDQDEPPSWCRIEILSTEGRCPAERLRLFESRTHGGISAPFIDLRARTESMERLVLSYWHDLTELGRYEIALHIQMGYGNAGVGDGSLQGRLIDLQHLQLEIGPRDPAKLRQIAVQLSQELVNPDINPISAIQALLSLPDREMQELWRAIASDCRPFYQTSDFVRLLSSLGDSEVAVEILGELRLKMQSSSSLPDRGRWNLVQRGLQLLATSPIPAVRERAEQFLKQ